MTLETYNRYKIRQVMIFFQTTLVRQFFDIFPTIDKVKLSQFQFPETTEIENSKLDGVHENVTLGNIYREHSRGMFKEPSFASLMSGRCYIFQSPEGGQRHRLVNALPDLTLVAHIVNKITLSTGQRFLSVGK